MKYIHLALALTLIPYLTYASTNPKATPNAAFRMMGDHSTNISFNPLERKLLNASCACDWRTFKELVRTLPKETTLKTVLIPNDVKSRKEFGQYTPSEDTIYARSAMGDIDKTSSIQGIVARRCPISFLEYAAHRAGELGMYGSSSMYMKYFYHSHANELVFFNPKQLQYLAGLSRIDAQLKLNFIKNATVKAN